MLGDFFFYIIFLFVILLCCVSMNGRPMNVFKNAVMVYCGTATENTLLG